jgi:hypothetical protein
MHTKDFFTATSRHALTLPTAVYAALKLSAERRGLEPNTLIQNLIIDQAIKDDTLDPDMRTHIEAGRFVIEMAVEVAKQRCRDGKPASTITLDTFRACAADEKWVAAYKTYVQDDIYKHGNPLKQINREIGFRIRAAIDGRVIKDDKGKPAVVKVLGEVIQSYTPMKSYDHGLVGGA